MSTVDLLSAPSPQATTAACIKPFLPLSCFITAALVGDLGHLIIKNSFQAVKDGHGGEVTSKTGIPAVVDVMEVVIESVKLSR